MSNSYSALLPSPGRRRRGSSFRVIQSKRLIHRVKGTRIDYVAIVNSETLEPVKEIKGKTLVALAVRLGKARLIDNILM